MNGKFACLIVVASVFVTGFVGYLANADVETDERQIYNYSANLVPSVVSSDVEQYSQYNPSDNVTGWQWNEPGNISNAKVPTTDTASPYVLTQRITGYTTDTISFADRTYFTTNQSQVILPDATAWNQGEVSVFTVDFGEGEPIVNNGYLVFVRDVNGVHVYLLDTQVDGTDIITDLDNIVANHTIESGLYGGGISMYKQYTSSNFRSEFSMYVNITDVHGLTMAQSSSSHSISAVPLTVVSAYQQNDFKTGDVLDLSSYRVYSVEDSSNIGWDLRYYQNSTHDVVMDYRWGATNASDLYVSNSGNFGLYYNKDTDAYYPAMKNANGMWYMTSSTQYKAENLLIVREGWQITELTWDKATVIPPTYADNTRFTQIGVLNTSTFGDTAVWRNNNSNGAITFLAKLNSDTGNLNITTRNKDGDGNYVVNGQWVAYANGIVTPTGYVQITLDNINGRYVYSPVTSIEFVTVRETIGGVPTDVQYANPNTAVVSNYTLNLGVVQSPNGSDMNEMDLRYASLTGEAYVTNTVIQLDPDGRMWSNPSIYLQVYFPDNFDADDTPRVWFNGFVAVGNKIIINGQTFQITDGYITVGSTSVELKAMAVDWEKASDGNVHVYISPKGVYENRIDIGVLNTEDVAVDLKMGGTVQTVHTQKGYVISTEGIWYFEVGLYDGMTEEYDKINLNLTKGWGLSVKGACLLFCGCMIFLTAAGVYYVKDNQPDFTDWLITVIVIVVAIAIAGLIG